MRSALEKKSFRKSALAWDRRRYAAASAFLFSATMISAPAAYAVEEQAQTFTYQGQLLDADGRSPMSGLVNFTFSILAPNGCLMYEEIQSGIDLTSSNGMFSVRIGSPKVGGASALRMILCSRWRRSSPMRLHPFKRLGHAVADILPPPATCVFSTWS
jgi:hypothetical protein